MCGNSMTPPQERVNEGKLIRVWARDGARSDCACAAAILSRAGRHWLR